MDERSFDQLARSLGTAHSRRRVLRTLAGGAFSALAAAVGLHRSEASAARLRSLGNSCSSNADCASGLCVQEQRTRKICHCQSAADCPAATDRCHSAACLPSGSCGFSVNAGAPCDDGDACTRTDACDDNGVCAGGNPVVCQPLDQCHDAGICDPRTGVCSNPARPDNAPCGTGQRCCGGFCCANAIDVCFGGTCCTPEPASATCAGTCGTVVNNCGQSVNCTPLCAGCCTGAGACEPGTVDAACGAGGTVCAVCAGFQTCGGGGTAGVCGCTPKSASALCAGICGSTPNGCGQSIACTPLCKGCCSGAVCEPGVTDAVCGRGGAVCAACDTTDPICGGGCSALSHTCAYAGSHTTCGHNRCADGTLTLAGACDGQGACAPGQSVSCDPYTCDPDRAACLTACGDDTECVAGDYCTSGGQCLPLLPNGDACPRSGACQSGNCVTGFCCASAACGPCESCASGVCAGTCSHQQTCCGGACKTAGGYECHHDSECCQGICVYPASPEATTPICCLPFNSDCTAAGSVCCSLICGTGRPPGPAVVCY